MVKNKALPDPADTPVWSLSLSFSLCLAVHPGPIKAGLTCRLSLSLADAVHPEGILWILSRLDPGIHGVVVQSSR